MEQNNDSRVAQMRQWIEQLNAGVSQPTIMAGKS